MDTSMDMMDDIAVPVYRDNMRLYDVNLGPSNLELVANQLPQLNAPINATTTVMSMMTNANDPFVSPFSPVPATIDAVVSVTTDETQYMAIEEQQQQQQQSALMQASGYSYNTVEALVGNFHHYWSDPAMGHPITIENMNAVAFQAGILTGTLPIEHPGEDNHPMVAENKMTRCAIRKDGVSEIMGPLLTGGYLMVYDDDDSPCFVPAGLFKPTHNEDRERIYNMKKKDNPKMTRLNVPPLWGPYEPVTQTGRTDNRGCTPMMMAFPGFDIETGPNGIEVLVLEMHFFQLGMSQFSKPNLNIDSKVHRCFRYSPVNAIRMQLPPMDQELAGQKGAPAALEKLLKEGLTAAAHLLYKSVMCNTKRTCECKCRFCLPSNNDSKLTCKTCNSTKNDCECWRNNCSCNRCKACRYCGERTCVCLQTSECKCQDCPNGNYYPDYVVYASKGFKKDGKAENRKCRNCGEMCTGCKGCTCSRCIPCATCHKNAANTKPCTTGPKNEPCMKAKCKACKTRCKCTECKCDACITKGNSFKDLYKNPWRLSKNYSTVIQYVYQEMSDMYKPRHGVSTSKSKYGRPFPHGNVNVFNASIDAMNRFTEFVRLLELREGLCKMGDEYRRCIECFIRKHEAYQKTVDYLAHLIQQHYIPVQQQQQQQQQQLPVLPALSFLDLLPQPDQELNAFLHDIPNMDGATYQPLPVTDTLPWMMPSIETEDDGYNNDGEKVNSTNLRHMHRMQFPGECTMSYNQVMDVINNPDSYRGIPLWEHYPTEKTVLNRLLLGVIVYSVRYIEAAATNTAAVPSPCIVRATFPLCPDDRNTYLDLMCKPHPEHGYDPDYWSSKSRLTGHCGPDYKPELVSYYMGLNHNSLFYLGAIGKNYTVTVGDNIAIQLTFHKTMSKMIGMLRQCRQESQIDYPEDVLPFDAIASSASLICKNLGDQFNHLNSMAEDCFNGLMKYVTDQQKKLEAASQQQQQANSITAGQQAIMDVITKPITRRSKKRKAIALEEEEEEGASQQSTELALAVVPEYSEDMKVSMKQYKVVCKLRELVVNEWDKLQQDVDQLETINGEEETTLPEAMHGLLCLQKSQIASIKEQRESLAKEKAKSENITAMMSKRLKSMVLAKNTVMNNRSKLEG